MKKDVIVAGVILLIITGVIFSLNRSVDDEYPAERYIEVKEKTIEVFDSPKVLLGVIEIDYNDAYVPNLGGFLSPNKNFLYYSWGLGDASMGFIYDIENDASHELGQVSVIKEAKWLNDNRFEFWRGCVTAFCTQYRSLIADTPWVIEEVN